MGISGGHYAAVTLHSQQKFTLCSGHGIGENSVESELSPRVSLHSPNQPLTQALTVARRPRPRPWPTTAQLGPKSTGSAAAQGIAPRLCVRTRRMFRSVSLAFA